MGGIYDMEDYRGASNKIALDEIKYFGADSKKLCVKLEKCYSGELWEERSSLVPGPVNNLITDRRWEEFPTHVTKVISEKKQMLQYLNVAKVNYDHFVVPFSLQVDSEAHVFLCYGDSVPYSRCYWFLFQGWQGGITAFRKCDWNEIQEKYDGKAPMGRCSSSTSKYENERWQEEKLCFDTDNNDIYLDIYNIRRRASSQSSFWAVHDIRTAQENELRILTPAARRWTGKCQLLGNGEVLDGNIDNIAILEHRNKCGPMEFGEDCVPCNVISDVDACPKASKYCQLVKYPDGDITSKCYCSIGYEGSQCKDVCNGYKYGHSCQKSCSNCQDGCRKDTIYGKCNSVYCTDNYLGEKCDIPPGIFIFDNLPEVEVGYTTCNVTLKSFAGKGGSSTPLYYIFQYKKEGEEQWQNGTWIAFKNSETVKLENLELEETYEVRAFGFSESSDIAQLLHLSDKVKSRPFSTLCKELDANDVIITPGIENVTVSFPQTNDGFSCNIERYSKTVNETNLQKRDGYYIATYLEPYSEYLLSIMKDGKEIFPPKRFTTKESIPGKVREFILTKLIDNTIILAWTKPEKTNGMLLYYTISKLVIYKACNSTREMEDIYVSAHEERWTFSDPKPYVKYEFQIKVNTSAGFGESSSTSVETDSIDSIGDEEIPGIKKVSTGMTETKIQFDIMKCEDLKGPLDVGIKFIGQNPWCNLTKNETARIPIENITIRNLVAFCIYEVTLKYTRNGNERDIETSIQTKEAVPNKIKDWLVTSKGPDHIYLRVLPPEPPTGHLTLYLIKIYFSKYWTTSSYLRTDTNYLTPCPFWPEFHCLRITDLTEDTIYTLEISSKNRGNNGSSEALVVQAKATELTPEKPYGLNVSWTEENHLNLEWFHPIVTNGNLKSFRIFVDGISMPEYTITSEKDYKAVYMTTVNQPFEFSDWFRVEVSARNSKFESQRESKLMTENPPPIPENFVKEITRPDQSIQISLGGRTYSRKFQIFFYMLFSECSICGDDLIGFKNDLVTHHKSYDELMESYAPHWYKPKMAHYSSTENSQRIFNISKEDSIKDYSGYTLAFIWIHKHAGYVRSNYIITFCGGSSKAPNNNPNLAGIIAAVISLLVVIAVLVFAFTRYKNQIFKRTRDMFASSDPIDSPGPDIAEATYVNQADLPLLGMGSKRYSTRPMSILFTEEICPGVPSFKTVHSKRVRLEDFQEYVKNAIEQEELKTQHGTFPRGQTKDWNYGIHSENKTKNRYQNLIAYDDTRVVLNKIAGDEYSDYINANFIDGYRHPRAYIATQGPKKNTVNDFWRMVWQEKVTHIVMMANVIEGNKKKTEQYWPNVNKEETFGSFRVTHISSEIFANYEYRKFELQYQYSKPRQVGQLHFKVWPDHGVPLYPQSLVPFLQRLLTLRSRDFPLVVHCSAGVGRTGTIILCDICLRMAAAEGCVDAFSMLEHIRSQRPNMVDNVEQYKLAHLVILNCLMGLRTSIPVNEDFEKSVRKFQDVDFQLRYIKNCEWQDDAMKTVAFNEDESPPMVPTKNRFANIVPDLAARVFLHPYSPAGASRSSTYINAVQVDGFCQPSRFIVTQFPLPTTTGDFWRLVAEQEISVIVCLNEIPARDPSCGMFWPQNNSELRPVEVVHVRHVKSKNLQVFSRMIFEISTFYDYKENQTRTVEILKFHGWKYPNLVPDPTDFITFVEDATMIARNANQVLVTCYDGATASGLFIAMSFLMEKIKLEQECDVCQAIRSIRTSRKQFANTKEQLAFLYKTSVLYVEERFLQYANIKTNK